MTVNAANRPDVRRLEKASQAAEKRRGEVVGQLMSSYAGREYVYHQLQTMHIFQTSYSDSAFQTYFREGERNQGLILLNDIMKFCPDQYVPMVREAYERDAAAERAGSQNANGGVEGPSQSDEPEPNPEAGGYAFADGDTRQ